MEKTTYKLVVQTIYTTTFEIEASSKEDAEQKLNDMYEEGSAYEVEMEQCITNTEVVSIEEVGNGEV